jgi:hypothetical protein
LKLFWAGLKLFFEEVLMPDILRALAISGSILIGVFIIVTIVAFVTVKRGEAGMAEDATHHGHSAH